MSDEKMKILEMLSSGKITVEEASKLLEATEKQQATSSLNFGSKFFYVSVEPKETEEGKKIGKVFVKVPFALIKAGVNIAGLIPKSAQDQINDSLKEQGMNFDFSNLSPDNIDELMASLELLTVEVDNADSYIKVFCK